MIDLPVGALQVTREVTPLMRRRRCDRQQGQNALKIKLRSFNVLFFWGGELGGQNGSAHLVKLQLYNARGGLLKVYRLTHQNAYKMPQY